MASRGFTLLELMMALAIATILTMLAAWLYRDEQLRADRAAVAALLQHDAVFLEAYYSQQGGYKETASRWPDLPYTQYPVQGVARYTIGFAAAARNTDNGYFVLRATAADVKLGYVELTQTGIMKYCVTEGSKERCRLA